MGKVIHWELNKKFKFVHTNKWYMLNLESVLENEMHKIFWEIDNGFCNLGQMTKPSDKKRKPIE